MIFKSYTKGSQILEVHYDDDSDDFNDPRNNDNLGIMVCYHNNYKLGDDQLSNGDLMAYFESCDIDPKDIIIQIPLWLYDHSGISMSCGDRVYPFNDQWDSGQVGFIYTTRKRVKDYLSWSKLTQKRLDKIEKYLINEVKEYDMFLRGECFNFVLYETKKCNLNEDHKEIIESCGGFLGSDYMLENLEDEFKISQWTEA